MRLHLPLFALLIACSGGDDTDTRVDTDTDARPDNEDLVIVTRLGEFAIDLFDDTVPQNAGNVRQYAEDGYYDGDDGGRATLVHNIEGPLFVEMGVFETNLAEKAVREPVPNESDIAPSNTRGTVAAMKVQGGEGATAGFLVNLQDNTYRDDQGFTVFGEVVRGMDVVDAIAAEPVESQPGFDAIPVDPVVLESVTAY